MLTAIVLAVSAICVMGKSGQVSGLDQFVCKKGDSINGTLKCNGHKDCPDGSDEIFSTCYDTKCAEGQFRCNYGGCVDEKLTCNGLNDCWDGSDENKMQCFADKALDDFLTELQGNCSLEYAAQCSDSDKCLQWSQICNGYADCPKGDDESAELCAGSICPYDSFRCENGACISGSNLCNRDIDCADGSDEIPDICQRQLIVPGSETAENVQYDELLVNAWQTNSCPLIPRDGMHVSDYFSEFSYRADAKVRDKVVVAVTCDAGFEIFGPNINKCNNNKWLNGWNVCMRVCQQIPHVRNVRYATQCINGAVIDCSQNTQVMGTTITVGCAHGYQAHPDSSQAGRYTCNSQGNWTVEEPAPKCEPICGLRSVQHPDITPWTVSIFRRDSILDSVSEFKCFGTIVSPYVVVSAEACFPDAASEASYLYYNVVEGNHSARFSQDEDHGYALHKILKVHIVTYAKQYKLAILTLVKPFKFGALVRPVCLTAEQIGVDSKPSEITNADVFTADQLGVGQTRLEENRHSLEDIIASKHVKYNVRGFVTAIRRDVQLSEEDV